MGLPVSKQFEVNQEPLSNRIARPTAAYTVRAGVSLVLADGSSSAFTVTMGPPEESAGMVKEVRVADASNAITVAGEGLDTIVMDAVDEFVMVMSSGQKWELIGTNYDNNLPLQFASASTISTAGNVTLTAAQLLGRIILRDPNGGARTDTLPTATLLIAAMRVKKIGSAFEFTIRNTADAAETITVAAGSGITLSGTATITQNNSKRFLAVITNVTSPAVTVYSLGTVVH